MQEHYPFDIEPQSRPQYFLRKHKRIHAGHLQPKANILLSFLATSETTAQEQAFLSEVQVFDIMRTRELLGEMSLVAFMLTQAKAPVTTPVVGSIDKDNLWTPDKTHTNVFMEHGLSVSEGYFTSHTPPTKTTPHNMGKLALSAVYTPPKHLMPTPVPTQHTPRLT